MITQRQAHRTVKPNCPVRLSPFYREAVSFSHARL